MLPCKLMLHGRANRCCSLHHELVSPAPAARCPIAQLARSRFSSRLVCPIAAVWDLHTYDIVLANPVLILVIANLGILFSVGWWVGEELWLGGRPSLCGSVEAEAH